MKLELPVADYVKRNAKLGEAFNDINLMLHMIDARLELLERLEKARNEG